MIYFLKQNYMGAAVSTGIFVVFLIGCFVIYGKDFLDYFERMKAYDKLRAGAINQPDQANINDKLGKYLEHLLLATNSKKLNVTKLKQLTMFLFTTSFLIVSYVLGLVPGFLVSVMVALLPIALIRLKLNTMQTKGSHEGEALVISLLSKYRVSSFNMEEAIEKVVKDENLNIPNSRMALYRLLYNVRGTKNPVLIRESINLFSYTMGTNWAKMLASNLYLAIISGTNVAPSIEDILVRLRSAGVLQEERRRKNAESVRIVKYVAPIVYIFLFFLAVQFIGMTPKGYLTNQLMTKEGLVMFLICIGMWIFNYVLVLSVRNQKFDY